jgi:RHS repeat-associated protein
LANDLKSNKNTMKKTTLILCVMGMGAAVLAEPAIGTRVAPPSERGYSVQAIRESGERGGLLVTAGTNFTAAYNQEMGDAMELWNAHQWKAAATELNRIWRQHPDSPWAAEAELHEACFLKFNSQFDEAEERFISVLKKYPNNLETRSKVLRYLPHLYAQTGRKQAALDAHLQMQNLPLNWQERQHLENYGRIFSQALAEEDENRLCGTKALGLALASQNDKGETLRNVTMEEVSRRFGWSRQKAAHAAGFSLQELADLSGGNPVQTDLETLRQAAGPGHPVLVYLKVSGEPKCFSIFEKPEREHEKPLTGHFVVVERVGDAAVDILDPSSGRCRWPLPQFVYRWSGIALALPGQNGLQGKTVERAVAAEMRGGCCGSPPPPPCDDECCDSGGASGGPSGNGPNSAGCNGCGGGGPKVGYAAPVYSFGLSSASFRLNDIPMWYPNAKGPTLEVQLRYSRVETQRMAQHTNVNYYPFGNKWHFNFASYLTETPDGGAEIVLPGGRVEHFNQTNGVYEAADIWNLDTLAKTNQWFVLTFEGSWEKWYFNTNTALQQRLEQMVDKYGNPLTLQYDNALHRLTNIVDAVSRRFRLNYNAQGYITNITDSLNRAAVFTYSSDGDLSSLTDMGGLTTSIQYDENHWPTNILYPSGNAWSVQYQTDNIYYGYTAPFRMVVTDPLGQNDEYFYQAFDYMGPVTQRDKTGNNWLFASKTVGSDGSARRTYYTAVNAQASPYRGTGDQWEHTEFDLDGNPAKIARAKGNSPTSIGYSQTEGSWVEDVLITNLFDGRHNLLSRTLLTNDGSALQLVGTWTNWYDANDNLLGTHNPLNQVTRYVYDAKDQLISVTNALNQVTRMNYDANGRMTNLVDALNCTNRWLYDTNGREYRSIYADGSSNSLGYDTIGRLTAKTNHGSGLYLKYTYDNLDRRTGILYPDGTSNHFEYSCCGLDWTSDRLHRQIYYGRDALGRTTQVVDPANRITQFEYNGADQITNLITWVGGAKRQKHFDYTSTNGASRLTKVTTPMGKLVRYDYTFRGGLAWRQDGKGNVTKFQYDPLERLVSVTDSNNVELAGMSYDVLDNATSINSQQSTFNYSYDPLNRATNVICLLTNIPGFATVKYRIDYAFDPAGNATNRTITGLQGFTNSIATRYQYDVMNRLTNVVQTNNDTTAASAGYQYDSAGRLWKKTYGNNDVVTHGYDMESRLLSLAISNSTTLVTRYNYQWDAGGSILAITNNGTNVTLYGYDRAGQLTNAVAFTNGLAGSVTNAWQYDEAGNWIAGDGKFRLYNADNEFLGISGNSTNAVTVTGQVQAGPNSNKWYHTTAECKGVSALVNTNNGTFSLPNVPIYPGTNELTVTVTDISGNSTQQVRHVTKSALETFRYDGNGNLTNWVSGTTNWVYEWDWADRLTKVSSNSVVLLQNWYDASGRRIAKQEVVNGQTQKWLYLYDGWNIIGVMNTNGVILETYTRGVGLAGDIGTLVAVTHHAGSTTNGTFYTHANHRGDVVLTRSGTTTVGTYSYSAFGNPQSAIGNDVCRFKFSSKEREASCGFSYYGIRFYAPQWQRWPNRDPIDELGGLNLYAFVGNEPIGYTDSLGLFHYYGNWGGPNLTGGQIGDYNHVDHSKLVPPIDRQDACFKAHDICYGKSAVSCSGSSTWGLFKSRANCDLNLYSCLTAVHNAGLSGGNNWQNFFARPAFLFRFGAISGAISDLF